MARRPLHLRWIYVKDHALLFSALGALLIAALVAVVLVASDPGRGLLLGALPTLFALLVRVLTNRSGYPNRIPGTLAHERPETSSGTPASRQANGRPLRLRRSTPPTPAAPEEVREGDPFAPAVAAAAAGTPGSGRGRKRPGGGGSSLRPGDPAPSAREAPAPRNSPATGPHPSAPSEDAVAGNHPPAADSGEDGGRRAGPPSPRPTVSPAEAARRAAEATRDAAGPTRGVPESGRRGEPLSPAEAAKRAAAEQRRTSRKNRDDRQEPA